MVGVYDGLRVLWWDWWLEYMTVHVCVLFCCVLLLVLFHTSVSHDYVFFPVTIVLIYTCLVHVQGPHTAVDGPHAR